MQNCSQHFWLVKFVPFRTCWSEIVQRGTFTPRGIRNVVARKHLVAMRNGDFVFFYHSQQELAVVGLMTVSREAYPDPTSADSQWLTCDFSPVKTLSKAVPLSVLRTWPQLSSLPLLPQPRLAVMPLTGAEHAEILNLSQL